MPCSSRPSSSVAAAAQTPEFLGTHRDWNVYAFTENSQKICYMASEPKKQEGDYTRRGNPAVLVTRRPGPKVVDEVSVQPGYSYKEGSEVEVGVGKSKFALFTRGEHAWTKSEDADRALINAMKRRQRHDRPRHLGQGHLLARHLLAARLYRGLSRR